MNQFYNIQYLPTRPNTALPHDTCGVTTPSRMVVEQPIRPLVSRQSLSHLRTYAELAARRQGISNDWNMHRLRLRDEKEGFLCHPAWKVASIKVTGVSFGLCLVFLGVWLNRCRPYPALVDSSKEAKGDGDLKIRGIQLWINKDLANFTAYSAVLCVM